jgi:hypothetical protein
MIAIIQSLPQNRGRRANYALTSEGDLDRDSYEIEPDNVSKHHTRILQSADILKAEFSEAGFQLLHFDLMLDPQHPRSGLDAIIVAA